MRSKFKKRAAILREIKMFARKRGISNFALSKDYNLFHATHEIPRLKAFTIMDWIYCFRRSMRKECPAMSAVKAL
jgi:hypothetical protein